MISQKSFHVHTVRKLNLRYTYMPFGSTPAPPCRLGEEQKHKAAQDEAETLKLEVEKVSGLEAANTELQSKVYIYIWTILPTLASGMWHVDTATVTIAARKQYIQQQQQYPR